MTTALTMILETVSDIIFLLSLTITLDMFYENSGRLPEDNKKRLIIAILASIIFSFIFNHSFFDQLVYVKWLLLFINYSKYVLLTAYIYKQLSSRTAMSVFIIQMTCSTIASGLLSLVRTSDIGTVFFINVLLILAVRTIMLLTAVYLKNKNENENMQAFIVVIPRYIYVLVMLSLFLSNGLIQTANFATSNISAKIYLIKIFASSVTICITVIIFSLLINVISEKYQHNANIALKKQISTQLYHYEQLEKINSEIRSFRHDYINHMKCIRSMLLNEQYDDLINYLNHLSDSFPASSFLFETGNYIADAILTEKQVNSSNDILIQFDGVIPGDIDNTDLCTILSNALDNAVEACCLCSGKKTIRVYGGFMHGYFVMKIKNPTAGHAADRKGGTTKSDKINHGFGLTNIKRTVSKYNGYVSTSCKDNFFTLNISFSAFNEDKDHGKTA